jgi:hypothetical protein
MDARSLGAAAEDRGAVDTVYVADKPKQAREGKGVKREWLDVSTTCLVGDEEPSDLGTTSSLAERQ